MHVLTLHPYVQQAQIPFVLLHFEVFLLIISFFLNLIQIILKVEQIFGIIVIGATTRRRVDGGSLFAGSL